MAKKRISAEERKEYKGGKYMGGPAEEKAEKKKPAKRMAMGGYTGPAGTNRGSWSGDGESLGVRTGKETGRTASNRPSMGYGMATGMPQPRPIRGPKQNLMMGAPKAPLAYEDMGAMFKRPGTGTNWPGQGRGESGMRGGGLARKGTGQALAKGGLVKGAGCCQRGMKKPRMK